MAGSGYRTWGTRLNAVFDEDMLGLMGWALLLLVLPPTEKVVPKLPVVFGIERGSGEVVRPLQRMTLLGAEGSVVVSDGRGRPYFSAVGKPRLSFDVAGALGNHTVTLRDGKGKVVARKAFRVTAKTEVRDEGGRYQDFLAMLKTTMLARGGANVYLAGGKSYRRFVGWMLDDTMTTKGVQYFRPDAAETVELNKLGQREDGMIWSFADADQGPGYHDTVYGKLGLVQHKHGLTWVRQPVEAMPEYFYVLQLWQAWRGNGSNAWMQNCLSSAQRALDFTLSDPLRWSSRYNLVRRAYTVDMWDFQAEDGYLVPAPLSPNMVVDPARTKFGVFYGDNTGYAFACQKLADMLEAVGRTAEAQRYRDRGAEVLDRVNALLWNGQFYTHRIEEDPAVTRDFGVDEATQVTLSNASSINRGIGAERAVAILKTYQRIRAEMPSGSPGEWFMCYPPFERGFGPKWEYMNGGVSATVAGELARGAFDHGFEKYGVDILNRVYDLGLRHNRKIDWAWKGQPVPPRPAANYRPVELGAVANMGLTTELSGRLPWLGTADDPGNDLRGLPQGEQTYGGMPFTLGSGVVGVSERTGISRLVTIPIGSKVGSLGLVHAVSGVGADKLAAFLTFQYRDGSRATQSLLADRDVAGWWFPRLATPNSGVAWTGPNAKSAAVGVTWARVDNPNPDREVTAVEVSAAPTGGVYVLAGLTVSEQPRPVPASDASFGGPDNWANASCVYALMEGLVGVVDTKPAYAVAQVAPRWAFAGVRRAQATVTYPASGGYVAYDYSLRKGGRLVLRIATSGSKVQLHLPLPAGIKRPELRVNGKVVPSKVVRVEGTKYVDANVVARGALSVVLQPATKARADFGLFRVLGLGGFLRRKIVNQGVNQIARARLAWP